MPPMPACHRHASRGDHLGRLGHFVEGDFVGFQCHGVALHTRHEDGLIVEHPPGLRHAVRDIDVGVGHGPDHLARHAVDQPQPLVEPALLAGEPLEQGSDLPPRQPLLPGDVIAHKAVDLAAGRHIDHRHPDLLGRIESDGQFGRIGGEADRLDVEIGDDARRLTRSHFDQSRAARQFPRLEIDHFDGAVIETLALGCRKVLAARGHPHPLAVNAPSLVGAGHRAEFPAGRQFEHLDRALQ